MARKSVAAPEPEVEPIYVCAYTAESYVEMEVAVALVSEPAFAIPKAMRLTRKAFLAKLRSRIKAVGGETFAGDFDAEEQQPTDTDLGDATVFAYGKVKFAWTDPASILPRWDEFRALLQLKALVIENQDRPGAYTFAWTNEFTDS